MPAFGLPSESLRVIQRPCYTLTSKTMTFRLGPFELDADGYRLTRRGELVDAEPRVLEVLAYLVAHRERLVGKEELVREVWKDAFVSDASITRAVSEARAALGDTGEEQRWITTVYGRGYQFVGEVEEPASAESPAPVGEPGSGRRGAGGGDGPAGPRPLEDASAGTGSQPPLEEGVLPFRGGRPLEQTRRHAAQVAEADPSAEVGPPVADRPRNRESLAWGLVVTATLAAAAFATFVLLRRGAFEEALEEPPQPFRAELSAPDTTTIASVEWGAIAVSPDGARIAFVTLADGERRLLVRDLESGQAPTLEGSEGATFPFWSPDGRWIGFFADGKVKKIPANGGPVQSLADAPHGRGGTWSGEGFIVYAPDILSPLVRIPDSGGDPSAVTELPSGRGGHYYPQVLPGSRHVLFDASDGTALRSIAVSSVEEPGETRILVEDGMNPQVADGFLFWVQEGTLIAQAFDYASLQLSGPSTPIARDLERGRFLGNFSVSAAGTLAWREERTELRQLVRFDRKGERIGAFGEPGRLWTFDFSHDGRRALVARGRYQESRLGWDLWVMDLDRRQTTRVTFSHARGISGVFSRDGHRVAVSIWGAEGGELWLQPASGAGEREHLLDTTVIHYVRDWSPDGETLLGQEQRTANSLDIVCVAAGEPGVVTELLATPYNEAAPRLAPDGEWIAYGSDESGQWEVYVRDFPARRSRWKISKGGLITPGGQPLLEWGPGGGAVYYAVETGLARVPVTRQGDRLELGEIEILGIDGSRLGPSRFLVDGDTVLGSAVTEESGEQPIRIVRHWRGLLEQVD